jgi:hypothetical protein
VPAENCIQMMQWAVGNGNTITRSTGPPRAFPNPLPWDRRMVLSWKARDAVLHSNGCTANMGFRTTKGYLGVMLHYRGSIFLPGWSPKHYVCYFDPENIPCDQWLFPPNFYVWEKPVDDPTKAWEFPVDKVGFKISISTVVGNPGIDMTINIASAVSSQSKRGIDSRKS